ncbi:MAG: rSAM/selenodomain-associated transferase 2 [Desulforhopalus sp.]|jgi:rSAM/selenodomain-associated transferase 2
MATPMSTLSIIVPVLNEEQTLGRSLEHLAGQGEIIVVDGGSTDKTVEIAQSAGATVIFSPLGRAVQMNIGAKSSSGDNLFFLHADTFAPKGFKQLIGTTLDNPTVAMGAFALGFNSGEKKLKAIAKVANLRSRFLQLPYGDQGFFMARSRYTEIGGFPEIEIMEDFVFVRKMKRLGRIVHLPDPVCTSSRRWQNFGCIKTTVINQLIVGGYLLGVSPSRLARMYQRLRGLN